MMRFEERANWGCRFAHEIARAIFLAEVFSLFIGREMNNNSRFKTNSD